MKRVPYLLGATGLALALGTVSCTTLGTHVKGGFACKAGADEPADERFARFRARRLVRRAQLTLA